MWIIIFSWSATTTLQTTTSKYVKKYHRNFKNVDPFFHFSEDDGDNEEPESESESESVDEEEIFAMLEKDVHAKPNEEDLPVEHHENIRVSPESLFYSLQCYVSF